MNLLVAIIHEIIGYTSNASDKSAIRKLIAFLTHEGSELMPANEFGEFQFLQYISYLSNNGSSKSTYNNTVRTRRLLQGYHSSYQVFPQSPELWPAPQKPRPSHFETLSDEQTLQLQEWLKVELDAIIKKEKLVEDAIKSGTPINKIGLDFRSKINKDDSLPRYNVWTANLKDAIATVYSFYPDYPFNKNKIYEYLPPQGIQYEKLSNPLITILNRMQVQNISSFIPFLDDGKELSSHDLIKHLYPDQFELVTIKTAISLETAWTFDIIDRIVADDYLYDTIPVGGDWAFIKSTKVKGGNSKYSDLSEQRVMIHPSSISNPHSAYSLISLLKKRTLRLRTGAFYDEIVAKLGCEPLCIYFNYMSKTLIVHHPNLRSDNEAVKAGKDKKQIKVKFEKSLGFYFDARRLRPTRLYLNEKERKLPLLLQVALFGHSTSAITDEVYKENAQFNQLRKDRLANELDEIVKSIDDGSFKGKLVPLRQDKTIKDRIINIYTNHSGESPLAVCNDPFRPDWSPMLDGNLQKKPCKQFNKCLLCSRSSVYSDNVPFVVDRYLYLDNKRRNMREEQFEEIYIDEFKAAKEVVESYPYQDEIKEAELRCAIEGYLLPPVISELG
ncbi:hypothetical protein L4D76_13680 [Photobacterium sagamiensis]|uniref:hypothetical protein n=1 Tax=Photobacterium sagamiensis TaxID=2910241 RepID=UPI003D14C999